MGTILKPSSAKKAEHKIISAKFIKKNMFVTKAVSYLQFKDMTANSVDQDEAAQ